MEEKEIARSEIWQKKVNPDDLDKMVGLSALNPMITVENLSVERKSYAFCEASEKSFSIEISHR